MQRSRDSRAELLVNADLGPGLGRGLSFEHKRVGSFLSNEEDRAAIPSLDPHGVAPVEVALRGLVPHGVGVVVQAPGRTPKLVLPLSPVDLPKGPNGDPNRPQGKRSLNVVLGQHQLGPRPSPPPDNNHLVVILGSEELTVCHGGRGERRGVELLGRLAADPLGRSGRRHGLGHLGLLSTRLPPPGLLPLHRLGEEHLRAGLVRLARGVPSLGQHQHAVRVQDAGRARLALRDPQRPQLVLVLPHPAGPLALVVVALHPRPTCRYSPLVRVRQHSSTNPKSLFAKRFPRIFRSQSRGTRPGNPVVRNRQGLYLRGIKNQEMYAVDSFAAHAQ